MARTTAEAVSAIVEADSIIDMTPFIETANALVTEKCASALDDDGNAYYDNDRLELIERWLSAWAYAIRDKRRTQETVRGITETFQHREDLGFDCNEYGQMAMRLDTAGGLAELNRQSKKGRTRIDIQYLGTENEEALV